MPQRMTITVTHNVEMAHRLFLTPGKCQKIHGHSWQVLLTLAGYVDGDGLLEGADFGYIKRVFRNYLDTSFDHGLLLNQADPLTKPLYLEGQDTPVRLPGLVTIAGDPTTEHFAEHVGWWAVTEFELPVRVQVNETATNSATWPAEGYVGK